MIENNKEILFEKFIAVASEKEKIFLNSLQISYQFLFLKNYFGVITRSQAIKLKCLDCTNYQREEITNCTIKKCALFKFRPYKKPVF